jgi:hypothetical protein
MNALLYAKFSTLPSSTFVYKITLDWKFFVYIVQVLVNGYDHLSTLLGVTKRRHGMIDGIANRVKPACPLKDSNEKRTPCMVA